MNQIDGNPEAIIGTLSAYITDEILGDGPPVGKDENLLVDGFVDSLGMLRLVGHIESIYNIKIAPDQFTVENFRNLGVIGQYVAGLLDAADAN